MNSSGKMTRKSNGTKRNAPAAKTYKKRTRTKTKTEEPDIQRHALRLTVKTNKHFFAILNLPFLPKTFYTIKILCNFRLNSDALRTFVICTVSFFLGFGFSLIFFSVFESHSPTVKNSVFGITPLSL